MEMDSRRSADRVRVVTAMPSPSEDWWCPPEVDFTVPHSARMYDYWLGGKTHFAVDRVAAEAVLDVIPTLKSTAQRNRRFIQRAAVELAAAGATQFLDIGTGIPTSPNLHEVVQAAVPAARVVYVDNDPMVLTHARALMVSSPLGRTHYAHADLREPQAVLAAVAASQVLDLERPVALVLGAVLHFLVDADEPYEIVRVLMAGLAPGSFLLASHATGDFAAPEEIQRLAEVYEELGISGQARSRAEFARFFDGLELLAPGIQPVEHWRPDPNLALPVESTIVPCYGALALKG
jgi:trans-aconitate methyltransferase